MRIFALCTCVLMLTASATVDGGKNASRKLVLVFHHVIGKQTLELGNTYINSVDDTVSIQRFRYYVSNFSVKDKEGISTKLPPSYFLVDEENADSKFVTMTIPNAYIGQLNFLLGVDSIRNVSGVQTGALDPLKGMFWTWNSGYIMAKLEGTSPSSHIAGSSFTYHIGGFRTPVQTMRAISLVIPSTTMQDTIHITADIDRWFSGTSSLRIAETPVCHSPGALAARIADNYAHMFYITDLR